jgi:HNH endonuclease
MSLPANFWAKTAQTNCIVWQGAQNTKGYGCFAVDRVSHLAHRLAWEDTHGPIPDGMTIDHTCRVRSCVNVAHLELVTNQENMRRARALIIGEECSAGHLIAAEADLYRRARGSAECRACRRDRSRRAREADLPRAG